MPLLAALLLALSLSPALAANYAIDPDASSVEFRVRHLVVNRVRGRFARVGGSFHHEAGRPESWRASVMVDAGSIDTGIKRRDEHLRSEDFLFVSSHPAITFLSGAVEPLEEGRFRLKGELTIRGVTKPIALEVRPLPSSGGPPRFEAGGTIDRTAFGVGHNDKYKAGSASIGKNVELIISVVGREDR